MSPSDKTEGGEKMIIFISLSDVTHGVKWASNFVSDRYGQDIANLYLGKLYRTRKFYRSLLRGEISEREYWKNVLPGLGIRSAEMRRMLSRSLRCDKSEMVETLKTIKSYPSKIPTCRGKIEYGVPDIQLLCDFIRERKDEVVANHPELFSGLASIASRAFWSFDYGQIKSGLTRLDDEENKDENKETKDSYISKVLQINGVRPYETLLIDSDPYTTTLAVTQFGMPSIIYTNPKQLKKSLLEFGFEF